MRAGERESVNLQFALALAPPFAMFHIFIIDDFIIASPPPSIRIGYMRHHMCGNDMAAHFVC